MYAIHLATHSSFTLLAHSTATHLTQPPTQSHKKLFFFDSLRDVNIEGRHYFLQYNRSVQQQLRNLQFMVTSRRNKRLNVDQYCHLYSAIPNILLTINQVLFTHLMFLNLSQQTPPTFTRQTQLSFLSSWFSFDEYLATASSSNQTASDGISGLKTIFKITTGSSAQNNSSVTDNNTIT